MYLKIMKSATVIAVLCFVCSAQQKSWSEHFKYKVPVQVKNTSEIPIEGTVMLKYPVQTLIKTKKIRTDAGDIYLVDSKGNSIPLQVCISKESPDSIFFKTSQIPAKSREIYYLYYGSSEKSNATMVINAPVKENPAGIIVTAGAEKCTVETKLNFPENLDQWLEKNNPDEFTGKVWVRCKIEQPENYKYCIVVDSETNPSTPARYATGTVNRYGVQPKWWTGNNDWGRPIAWVAPVDDTDWLNAGEYSCWAELPVSRSAHYFTCFIVIPQNPAKKEVVLHLEFASEPSEDFIFHTIEEKIDKAGPNYYGLKYIEGALAVRMPTKTGLEGLKELGTFAEYTMKRLEMIEKMNFGEPPHLTDLIIGTWVQLIPYRVISGETTYEKADTEFKILSSIGINSITASGIKDDMFTSLCKKYGIINTTITGWAGNWRYTSEAYAKQYDYKPGENSHQRWLRVFDDFYSKMANRYSSVIPQTMKIAKHFNTGDEIGPAINAREIVSTPQLLDEFRQHLKNEKLTPKMLGKNSWDEVYPETDRKKLEEGNIGYNQLFYHTKKFINNYTAIYYKCATDAIKKYFPDMQLIAPNFQAGPMQFAFIGNNNDMNTSGLDIFELGRKRAFEGIMMEDWVYGWDAGIGRICLGADIMRAASRKWNLPMASYLVGGEAIRSKLFAYLMAGIKENLLYLYGPVGNIGPAWADNEKALRETADITRRLKRFEKDISQAKVRPAKIAQLIAFTSDLMQVKGLYFCPERQDIYTLLKHSYYSVDIICEQDIVEDDILKNYSVLIITDPNIHENSQKKIAEWVYKGGKLIAIVGAGNWNQYNQESSILNSVFGFKQQKIITQDDWLKWASAFYSTTVSKFAYKQMGTITISQEFAKQPIEIPVWGVKFDCIGITCKTIGKYEDGKPAVFVNKYGKGQAFYIGALLGQAYVRQHWNINSKPEQYKLEDGLSERSFITAIMDYLGVKKYYDVSTPGIYTQLMDYENGVLVFLNNASGKPIENLVLTVHGVNSVNSVDSITFGTLNYKKQKDTLIIEIPLENVDIVRIKRM
ncbi:MAG: hypothetical protein ACPL3Q_04575 [Candidatus Ratteibacteria bacterium]